MSNQKFKLGNLEVSVRTVGISRTRGSFPVFEYKVLVSDPHSGAMYRSPAWGSINDYKKNRHDFEGIGAMVVEELLQANSDPDEFIDMVGPTKGNSIVQSAEAFEYDELLEAVGEAIQRGLI